MSAQAARNKQVVDIGHLTENAPQWWLEHIAEGWRG
jgi:hypothetical protein